MTTQIISVESLLVLTSIISDGTLVCVNSVEHNGYDDSDFCDIILDLANRDIREVCTHTTRGAGYTSSNSVAIATYSDEVRKALMAEFMTIGKEMALKYFQEHSVIHVGGYCPGVESSCEKVQRRDLHRGQYQYLPR